jgi:branched-subunit amino acid ABC-type transport system permease component
MTTGLWIYIIIAAVSMSAVMHTVLTRTKIGKAMRAASSNPELALASGIDVDKVALLGWSIGAALAGIGGLFRALDTRIVPMIGWEMLIPTFAATILGGIGSFYGALVAAYLIGLAENLGLVALSAVGLSTEYRPAIAFIILILTLILKPAGLGKLFRGG